MIRSRANPAALLQRRNARAAAAGAAPGRRAAAPQWCGDLTRLAPDAAAGMRQRCRYVANDCQIASTRALTAGSIAMGRPHWRAVSPGHLFVASMPILLPRPATGEAKSR